MELRRASQTLEFWWLTSSGSDTVAAGCCFSRAGDETFMEGESVEKCLNFSLAHFQQEKMKVVKANNDNLESQKHSRGSPSLREGTIKFFWPVCFRTVSRDAGWSAMQIKY